MVKLFPWKRPTVKRAFIEGALISLFDSIEPRSVGVGERGMGRDGAAAGLGQKDSDRYSHQGFIKSHGNIHSLWHL